MKPMNEIRSIIHIYRRREEVYVVPLVRLSQGPWLETTPVSTIAAEKPGILAASISDAHATAGNVVDSAPNAWDSEVGEELRQAEAMCALRWYENGKVRVIPHCYRPSLETDGEEESWSEISDASVELSARVEAQELARLVRRCLRL